MPSPPTSNVAQNVERFWTIHPSILPLVMQAERASLMSFMSVRMAS